LKRDIYDSAFALVEYGVALGAAISLSLQAVPGMLWESVVHLAAGTDLRFDTAWFREGTQGCSRLCSPEDLGWDITRSWWRKGGDIVKFLAGLVEAGGEPGGEAIGGHFHGSANEKFKKELRSL
jgi:hypothetical protein